MMNGCGRVHARVARCQDRHCFLVRAPSFSAAPREGRERDRGRGGGRGGRRRGVACNHNALARVGLRLRGSALNADFDILLQP